MAVNILGPVADTIQTFDNVLNHHIK